MVDYQTTPFTSQKYSCPIDGHDLQDITLVCTDPKCQLVNRVMCVYCLYQDHNDHKDKVCLIRDIESSEKPFITHNWPSNKRIKTTCQLFHKGEKDTYQVKVIDPLFDDLKEKIVKEVENVRKWVHQNTAKMTLKGTFLKNKIEEGYSLEPLQQIFRNFSDKYSRKQVEQKHTFLDEINDYVDQFMTFDRESYADELKNLYKKEIIKGGRLQYDEVKLREVIYNIKIFLQQVKPSFFVGPMDIKFYRGEGPKVSPFVELIGNRFIFEGSRGLGTIVYSDVFQRQRNFCLKFQIVEADVGHESFYFGVTANEHKDEIFWFNSGNQIDLFQTKLYSKKPFKQLDNTVPPGQILGAGVIFIAEVCIDQNILKIYDQNMLSVQENQYIFEDKFQDWRLVFGVYSKHVVTVEVLDIWAYIN